MDSNQLHEALSMFSEVYNQLADKYEADADNWWAGLSEQDKLLAFYSVCKRIYKGEIEDRGSYRHVLYSVFGFGPEAYSIGMECNFLELHNCIYTSDEIKKLKNETT